MNRYAPDGDIYASIADQYGTSAAQRAYAASLVDDGGVTLRNVLSNLHTGSTDPGSTSTWSNFWRQITTDPLAAPLDSLDNQLGNAVLNVFKNPFVLLLVAGLVFHWFGGFTWLKRKLSNA